MGFTSWGHWLLLGVVMLLLFGKGRFSAMMGDVAQGIKSFKKGMSEEDEAAATAAKPAQRIEAGTPGTVIEAEKQADKQA